MKLSLILPFLFLSMGCGQKLAQNQIQEAPQIVGGKKVAADDPIANSVVAIYNVDDTYLCSGTIIGKNIILTAGHCVTGKPESLIVIFGLKVDSPDLISRKVVNEIRHENYEEDNQSEVKNDIALLRFSGGLPDGFTPLPYVTRKLNLKVESGSRVTFAGFGLDRNWFGNYLGKSGTLRKVDMVLKKTITTDTDIEVEDWRKGTCSGDSGGPGLILSNSQYYVWGITSRGGTFGKIGACFKTGFYTRVESYAGWIKAHIKHF